MTFEEIRRRAYGVIGDAEDWLRSDWSDEPTLRQARAMQEAARHLDAAKTALNDAVRRPNERGR